MSVYSCSGAHKEGRANCAESLVFAPRRDGRVVDGGGLEKPSYTSVQSTIARHCGVLRPIPASSQAIQLMSSGDWRVAA